MSVAAVIALGCIAAQLTVIAINIGTIAWSLRRIATALEKR
jgi:hypothetical protein